MSNQSFPELLKHVYAVYDKKSGSYPHITIQRSHAEAMRAFEIECTKSPEDSPLKTHKEDFEFHLLGDIATVKGELIANKKVMAKATDY